MRLRHLALPAAAGLTLLTLPFAPAALAAAPECDDSISTCTAAFGFTGGVQSFTVPAGVSNLALAIAGAGGGDGFDVDANSHRGGSGGSSTAIVPVTPGEVLTIVVGGRGGDANLDGDTPAAGGYGGGGAGTLAGSGALANGSTAGGGGGSFVFGSDGLLIAVGGGGGGGFSGEFTGTGKAEGDSADGGRGSAETGRAGSPADLGGGGAKGEAGAGGTAGGGEDGTAGSGPATSASAFGNGGASTSPCGAAGGGGGYFGGGSGGCEYGTETETAKRVDGYKAGTTTAAADIDFIARAGGGGGGSGFHASGVSIVGTDFIDSTDDGVVVLSYTTAPTTTTIAADATTLAPGQETTINATVDGPDLQIVGDDAEDSPAAQAAAKAFGKAGAQALAKAAAVPTQPATPGTTLTPATACEGPEVPRPSGVPPTACTVTFFVNGAQLGDPIDIDPATGVASVVFTAGSEQGVREITARYDGNLYYLQSTSDPLSLTVAGLANTGPSNVLPMLTASAVLLVAGAGLVAFGRRRPQLGAHRAV